MRIILCGCKLYVVGNKTLKEVVISVCLADTFNVTGFLKYYTLLNSFLFVCSSFIRVNEGSVKKAQLKVRSSNTEIRNC